MCSQSPGQYSVVSVQSFFPLPRLTLQVLVGSQVLIVLCVLCLVLLKEDARRASQATPNFPFYSQRHCKTFSVKDLSSFEKNKQTNNPSRERGLNTGRWKEGLQGSHIYRPGKREASQEQDKRKASMSLWRFTQPISSTTTFDWKLYRADTNK